MMEWFKKLGWIYQPISIAGWIITIFNDFTMYSNFPFRRFTFPLRK
jgi:hypothetical protein